MAVAESHSSNDGLSSSSPDCAASRFTPPDSNSSSNDHDDDDDDYGARRTDPVQQGGRPSAEFGMSEDMEAYELRDMVTSTADLADHGRAESITDDDDDDDDDKGMGSDMESLADHHQSLVYTVEEERAVVKKFDRRLVLFVALLYMLSFLDRSSSSHLFFLLMVPSLVTSRMHAWILRCLLSFLACPS